MTSPTLTAAESTAPTAAHITAAITAAHTDVTSPPPPEADEEVEIISLSSAHRVSALIAQIDAASAPAPAPAPSSAPGRRQSLPSIVAERERTIVASHTLCESAEAEEAEESYQSYGTMLADQLESIYFATNYGPTVWASAPSRPTAAAAALNRTGGGAAATADACDAGRAIYLSIMEDGENPAARRQKMLSLASVMDKALPRNIRDELYEYAIPQEPSTLLNNRTKDAGDSSSAGAGAAGNAAKQTLNVSFEILAKGTQQHSYGNVQIVEAGAAAATTAGCGDGSVAQDDGNNNLGNRLQVFTVGSLDWNDVHVAGTNVSRLHMVVFCYPKGTIIVDGWSFHGTRMVSRDNNGLNCEASVPGSRQPLYIPGGEPVTVSLGPWANFTLNPRSESNRGSLCRHSHL